MRGAHGLLVDPEDQRDLGRGELAHAQFQHRALPGRERLQQGEHVPAVVPGQGKLFRRSIRCRDAADRVEWGLGVARALFLAVGHLVVGDREEPGAERTVALLERR